MVLINALLSQYAMVSSLNASELEPFRRAQHFSDISTDIRDIMEIWKGYAYTIIVLDPVEPL